MRPDCDGNTGDGERERVAFLDADGAHVTRVDERDRHTVLLAGVPLVVLGEDDGGLVGDDVEYPGRGLDPVRRMVDGDGAYRVGALRVGDFAGMLQDFVGERAVVRRVEGGADRITVVEVGVDSSGAGGRGRGKRGDQADTERDRGDSAARAPHVRRETCRGQFARQSADGQDRSDDGHEHRDKSRQGEHQSERQDESANQCDGHMEAGRTDPQQRYAGDRAHCAEHDARNTAVMRPVIRLRAVAVFVLCRSVQCLDRWDARGVAHGRPCGQYRGRNGQQ